MIASKFSKHQRLITILLVAITVIGGMAAFSGCGRGQPIEIFISEPVTQETVSQIYIGGAVANPGFYPLKAGDSLEALIQVAGGLTGSADLNRLELYIPRAGEEESPQKIDINQAPAWLLEALPGIGEVRAEDILNYRNLNGPFSNTNELLKVKGIGTATYEAIKDLITVASECWGAEAN